MLALSSSHNRAEMGAFISVFAARRSGASRPKLMMNTLPSSARGIVVTGASKGVGFALAKKFAELGHKVTLCARNEERLDKAVSAIKGDVYGVQCDVADAASVEKLAKFAQQKMGRIDIWINNAGTTSYVRRPLKDIDPDKLEETIRTNLCGSMICARQAIRTMEAQNPPGGHIFNMEGAGSFGDATKGYAAYGATKRALPQFNKTLVAELKDSPVGAHLLSPGMVLTDLLLADSTTTFKRFFNLIAEEPETVAENLAPRILNVSGSGKAIRFLTVPSALFKIVTGALFRRNKFFDANGNRIAAGKGRYDSKGVKQFY
mmetsp:Transcript_8750/g.26295  ORF Transcript_8750/g.26295 Transcript_8750/m.26295 type:complete len:318 (+) Transcript_8750:84-1037(+)